MTYQWIGQIALGTTLLAVLAGSWALRAPRALPGREDPEAAARAPWWPTALLWATLLLLYVNQVLFNVYILEVHAGDPAFLGDYLPSSFLHLALQDPVVQAVAAWVPDARVLEPTVLRVQAVLELPFVLGIWLAVVALLDPWALRVAASPPLGALLSLSTTAVLVAIEERLRNPWTDQDIYLRWGAAIVAIPLVWALAGRGPRVLGPPRTLALLRFAVGVPALAGLALATNAVALLYNLEWMESLGYTFPFFGLWAVGAAQIPAGPPAGSPVVATLHASARRFALFFGPGAIAMRYAASASEAQELVIAAGALAFSAALLGGAWEVSQGLAARARWTLVASLVAGALAGAAALALEGLGMFAMDWAELPDVWLAARALVFAIAFLAVAVYIEWLAAPPEA